MFTQFFFSNKKQKKYNFEHSSKYIYSFNKNKLFIMNTFFYLSKWITQWSQKPHKFTEFDYHIHNNPQNYMIITDLLIIRSLGHMQVQTLYGHIDVLCLKRSAFASYTYQFRTFFFFLNIFFYMSRTFSLFIQPVLFYVAKS